MAPKPPGRPGRTDTASRQPQQPSGSDTPVASNRRRRSRQGDPPDRRVACYGARLASGAQLFRLHVLGLLIEAMCRGQGAGERGNDRCWLRPICVASGNRRGGRRKPMSEELRLDVALYNQRRQRWPERDASAGLYRAAEDENESARENASDPDVDGTTEGGIKSAVEEEIHEGELGPEEPELAVGRCKISVPGGDTSKSTAEGQMGTRGALSVRRRGGFAPSSACSWT
jgi:hypothetical protein